MRVRPAALFAGAVAGLPLLAAVVVSLGGPWYPVADDALISLRTDDVLTGANPLVGVYSRFGWNHPGPALFATLKPFQEVLGTRGLIVGAGAVGTASLAFSMWLLWRRGGAPLVTLGGVAFLLLVLASGGDIVDPWNPYVAVLPLVALVVTTWSVLDGDRWLVPVVVGIGSWLVQVHVGYLLLALVLVVAALVARLLPRPRRDAGAELAVAAAVAVVLWLAPVIEQLTGDPGNFRRLLDAPAGDVVGLRRAADIAAQQLVIPRGWLFGDDRIEGLLGWVSGTWAGWLLVVVLVGAGAAFAVWRHADDRVLARSALRLQGLVAGLVVAGVVSIARIQGPPFPYLVRWQWVVAMFVWTSALWSVLVATGVVVRHDAAVVLRPGTGRVVRAGVATVAGLLLIVTAVSLVGAPRPDEALSDTVAAVVDPVARSIAADDVVRIRAEGEDRDELRNGIGAALERRGVDVQYPVDVANRVGDHRAEAGPVDADLVVSLDEFLDRRLGAGEAPVVLRDPLTPAERATLDRLDAKADRALEAALAGRPARLLSDREQALRSRLEARGPRFAVFREGADRP